MATLLGEEAFEPGVSSKSGQPYDASTSRTGGLEKAWTSFGEAKRILERLESRRNRVEDSAPKRARRVVTFTSRDDERPNSRSAGLTDRRSGLRDLEVNDLERKERDGEHMVDPSSFNKHLHLRPDGEDTTSMRSARSTDFQNDGKLPSASATSYGAGPISAGSEYQAGRREQEDNLFSDDRVSGLSHESGARPEIKISPPTVDTTSSGEQSEVKTQIGSTSAFSVLDARMEKLASEMRLLSDELRTTPTWQVCSKSRGRAEHASGTGIGMRGQQVGMEEARGGGGGLSDKGVSYDKPWRTNIRERPSASESDDAGKKPKLTSHQRFPAEKVRQFDQFAIQAYIQRKREEQRRQAQEERPQLSHAARPRDEAGPTITGYASFEFAPFRTTQSATPIYSQASPRKVSTSSTPGVTDRLQAITVAAQELRKKILEQTRRVESQAPSLTGDGASSNESKCGGLDPIYLLPTQNISGSSSSGTWSIAPDVATPPPPTPELTDHPSSRKSQALSPMGDGALLDCSHESEYSGRDLMYILTFNRSGSFSSGTCSIVPDVATPPPSTPELTGHPLSRKHVETSARLTEEEQKFLTALNDDCKKQVDLWKKKEAESGLANNGCVSSGCPGEPNVPVSVVRDIAESAAGGTACGAVVGTLKVVTSLQASTDGPHLGSQQLMVTKSKTLPPEISMSHSNEDHFEPVTSTPSKVVTETSEVGVTISTEASKEKDSSSVVEDPSDVEEEFEEDIESSGGEESGSEEAEESESEEGEDSDETVSAEESTVKKEVKEEQDGRTSTSRSEEVIEALESSGGPTTTSQEKSEVLRDVIPSEMHRRPHYSLSKTSSIVASDNEESLFSPLSIYSESRATTAGLRKVGFTLSPGNMGGEKSFFGIMSRMVKMYIEEENVRAKHQDTLLELREKAIRDKTKVELEWLKLREREIKSKGDDEQMLSLKKRERGLLRKLEKEKAEIQILKRVQAAARQELKMMLMQYDEISRMRQSTQYYRQKISIYHRRARESTPKEDVGGARGELQSGVISDRESSVLSEIFENTLGALPMNVSHSSAITEMLESAGKSQSTEKATPTTSVAMSETVSHLTIPSESFSSKTSHDNGRLSSGRRPVARDPGEQEKLAELRERLARLLSKQSTSTTVSEAKSSTSAIPEVLSNDTGATLLDPVSDVDTVTSECNEIEARIQLLQKQLQEKLEEINEMAYEKERRRTEQLRKIEEERKLVSAETKLVKSSMTKENSNVPPHEYSSDEDALSPFRRASDHLPEFKEDEKYQRNQIVGSSPFITSPLATHDCPSVQDDEMKGFENEERLELQDGETELDGWNFFQDDSFVLVDIDTSQDDFDTTQEEEEVKVEEDKEIPDVQEGFENKERLELQDDERKLDCFEFQDDGFVLADEKFDMTQDDFNTTQEEEDVKVKEEEEEIPDVQVGEEVIISGRELGIVRFVGKTHFAVGYWIGIEIPEPIGLNDGSIEGRRYFDVPFKCGVFAPPFRVERKTEEGVRRMLELKAREEAKKAAEQKNAQGGVEDRLEDKDEDVGDEGLVNEDEVNYIVAYAWKEATRIGFDNVGSLKETGKHLSPKEMLKNARKATSKPGEESNFDDDEDDLGSTEVECREAYVELVFQLALEIIETLHFKKEEPPVWATESTTRVLLVPHLFPSYNCPTMEDVQKRVYASLMRGQMPEKLPSLKFLHKDKRPGRKAIDTVDRMLIQELRREEPEWVDYCRDEQNVKVKVADALMNSLLVETAKVTQDIIEKKAKSRAKDAVCNGVH